MQETDESGSLDFLLADLDGALKSIDCEPTSGDRNALSRKIQKARQVYDNVVRLIRNVTLDAASQQLLENRLAALRIRLQAAGESFSV